MSVWDDAAAAAGRYGDDATALIRRLLGRPRPAAGSAVDNFAYDLGADVPFVPRPAAAADAVEEAIDPAADMAAAASATARQREAVQAAEQAALDQSQAAAAQARYRRSTAPPPSLPPEAKVAAAGAAAGGAGLALFGDDEPVVTSGGTAELAAEVPPLAVKPEPEVGAPAPKSPSAPAKPAAPLTDRDRLRARRAQLPQVSAPEVANRMAADSLLADEAAARASEREARLQEQYDRDAAARKAVNDKMEAEYEAERASYDENGRPRLPVDRKIYIGNNMKIDPITGRPVNMSDREIEADARADMRTWGGAEPGSARQAQYDPQGYAEWERSIGDKISADAQNELAISASPFASQMRKDSEARQSKSNIDTRQKIYEARANPLARNQMSDDEKARRAAVVRRAQARGNPLEYLGRDDINDWQQYVMSRALLGGQITDPNAVKATHNQQLTELGLRTAMGRGFQPITPETQALGQAQVAKAENELPIEDHATRERDRNEGKLPANSSAGQRVLAKIASEKIGPYATDAEVNEAVREAVKYGIDAAEAEAHFAPRRRSMYQWATGT